MSAKHIIYYTWATSEVAWARSSEGLRGSFGRFFEELRRSSVLSANVGAVSKRTCVAIVVLWALLRSTGTLSWATAWPKWSFFGAFLWFLGHSWKLSGSFWANKLDNVNVDRLILALTSVIYQNMGEKDWIYNRILIFNCMDVGLKLWCLGKEFENLKHNSEKKA